MIDYYKKQAKKCFDEYQKAIDLGDTKSANYYMQEYLTYDKIIKSQKESQL